MRRVLYKFFSFILVFSLSWCVFGCEPFGSSKGAGAYDGGYGPTSPDVGPGTGTPYVYGGGGQSGPYFPQYLYVPSLGSSYPPPEVYGSLNILKLSQDGSLELVGGPVSGGSNHPQDSFISPDGKYVYVGDPWDFKVNSYKVDPSSHALTSIESHLVSAESYSSMALGQVEGRVFGYIAGWYGLNKIIAGLGQDQVTGALVDGPVVDESLSGYTYSPPRLAVLQGKYLYALGDSKIVQREIKTDGSFKPDKPEVATRGETEQFVFSPDGRFAYALQRTDYDRYSVDSGTGELTEVGQESFNEVNSPLKALSHPSKPLLFVLDGESKSVYTYSIKSPDGSLEWASSLTSLPNTPSTMVMDLSGQYLLVGISHTQVPKESGFLVYKIDSDGALSPVSSFPNELFYTLAEGCTIAVGR